MNSWPKNNAEMIERYPFLRNRETNGLVSFHIPYGYKKLFYQMCEDITSFLKVAPNVHFYFKFIDTADGKMDCDWYISGAESEVDKFENIILKYESLSRYVCVECGRLTLAANRMGGICPVCAARDNRQILYQYNPEDFRFEYQYAHYIWDEYMLGTNQWTT